MIFDENLAEQINSLYEECLTRKEQFHSKIDICMVPDVLAQIVLEATGVDIANHLITIDNYGIIHTLLQHGNPISEAKEARSLLKRKIL